MQEIKISDIIGHIENFAPIALQEDYDNCGLQIGDSDRIATGILITLDVNEAVLNEAVANNCNLIISHHPITLSGIKKITPDNLTGRIVLKAAQKNIAIYSAHTNIDSVKNGVSMQLAKKLGLDNYSILETRANMLIKLVTFVPNADAERVRVALFEAGAGHIGNYDCCSYNLTGHGTFRGNDLTNPYAGKKGELHTEEEIRIETIFPTHLQNKVVKALISTHPYEEPAYDLYPLKNQWNEAGYGVIGDLPEALSPNEFLQKLKSITGTGYIRYTEKVGKPIKKVAVCGGSGSFLVKKAASAGADAFVSGDFKYHQFFEAPENMMIADIGHYESEQFTKELFFEVLTKKFPNFAIRLSNVNTNPIKYF